MENNHTPGQWSILDESQAGHTPAIVSNGKFICELRGPRQDWSPSKETEANAHRIVACVNACEGINPEAVPAMLEALKEWNDIWHFIKDHYPDVELPFSLDKKGNDAAGRLRKAIALA